MTRREIFARSFSDLPHYRERQVFEALFRPDLRSFEGVTTLPLSVRERLLTAWPWLSVKEEYRLESKRHDTWKAILSLTDGARIETVLMLNARGHWSICVSSQVGCAMACTFCATGKMGFTRNLTADEIVDQYRYWLYFLDGRRDLKSLPVGATPQVGRITNVVYMGMGEPLANYAAVKESLQTLLAYTDLGPTRITVSTVGLLPALRKILDDAEWPAVRLAVSLHSAHLKTRASIMPSSTPRFLDDLAEWTRAYFKRFASRRRHLTFEYVMLSGVNDSSRSADELIAFARKIGKAKINLIPYNDTPARKATQSVAGGKSQYHSSAGNTLEVFQSRLRQAGVDVTRRRTMGADIAAACGQLIVETKTSREPS